MGWSNVFCQCSCVQPSQPVMVATMVLATHTIKGGYLSTHLNMVQSILTNTKPACLMHGLAAASLPTNSCTWRTAHLGRVCVAAGDVGGGRAEAWSEVVLVGVELRLAAV